MKATTHQEYIERLPEIAQTSQDPDTQIACIIAVNGAFISAANRLPNGVPATEENTSVPGKYLWIQHAERSAIAFAASVGYKLAGSVMYLNWFPCAECAGSIVNSKIKTLFASAEKYSMKINDPRYSFDVAWKILELGGVKIKLF